MKSTNTLLVVAGLIATSTVVYQFFSGDPHPLSNSQADNARATHTPAADLQPISQEPEVTAYLQRGEDKQQLQEFFADQGQLNADEAWALINSLEQEQRVLGFEALHLKLAWLEKQHQNRESFEAAAQALMEEYRQRAAEQTPYRPEDIPGFTDYKARELAIIDQVNQMQAFPNGMSREEYLREQLLEARLEAYGEKR